MNGVGQMFQADSLPRWWHMTRVPEPLKLEAALDAGGLNWNVTLMPLAVMDAPGTPISQRKAVVRCDRQSGTDGRVLGVVHPDFKPLQNADGAALFDNLLGAGGRHYVCGGHLGNGERVWLQTKLRDPIRVIGDDVLDTYLLFSNSHDGSQAIDIRLTTVRVWCENSLSEALGRRAQGVAFRRAHKGSYAVVAAEAEVFFREVMATQARLQHDLGVLAHTPCDDSQFKRFLETLLATPAEPATVKSNAAVRQGHETRLQNIKAARAAVFDIHANGLAAGDDERPAIEPAPKTWWGALNSCTAWVDHATKIKGDRFAHLMFGEGDRLKRNALASARREVGLALAEARTRPPGWKQ